VRLEVLDDGGLQVGTLVVNRVLPDDADGAYVAARRAQQGAYLAELDARFRSRTRVRVVQLDRDVADRVSLARIRDQLGELIG
jgi:arsenite/tail-anchored protein-transporting ATPase